MHRFVRLLLFVLMGVLPLCALLAWGVYRHTETYQNALRKEIESAMKLPMEVGRFRFLRPGKMRLEDVKIFRAGHSQISAQGMLPVSQPLMEMPWVEVIQATDYDGDAPLRRVELVLPELTLEPGCLEPLWEFHQGILARSDMHGPAELRVTVAGPVRVRGSETLELLDGRLWMRPAADGVGHETDISFRFPENGAGAAAAQWSVVRINFRRVVGKDGAAIYATITTDEKGLPTPLLASLFPPLEKLGAESRFYERIILRQTFAGWSGVFQGRFTPVDMSRYFAGTGQAGQLVGRGTLELRTAEFQAGRLVRAEGRFFARDGWIHRSLLDAIIPMTGLTTRGIPLEMSPSVTFTQLAFGFTLSDGKIELTGACEGHGPGVYLVGRNGPILCEPPGGKPAISAAMLGE